MATLTLTGVIITPTTEAATFLVDLTRGVFSAAEGGIVGMPATLELIGTLGSGETISVEYPLVADPDPTDDADWAQYYYRDEAIQLTSTNHSETNVTRTLFRINKTATAAAAGVRIV